LDVAVELRVARFAVKGLLEGEKAAKGQAMLDRIDRMESFANAALLMAGEMRKTIPLDIVEPTD